MEPTHLNLRGGGGGGILNTFCLLYIFPNALLYSLNQTGISLYNYIPQNHVALMLPFTLDADLKPQETPFIH